MDPPLKPTRRSNGAIYKSSSPPPSPPPPPLTPPSSASFPPNHHRRRQHKPTSLFPTLPELLLLSTYPALLLTGSLFSTLDPTARAAPYDVASQSHPPAYAPSYFARKSNVLNTYFVKVGWFWVSLAFGVWVWVLAPRLRDINTRSQFEEEEKDEGDEDAGGRKERPLLLQALLRYALVTAWWGSVTQWFFGPAIIDRGFRLTGGMCEGLAQGQGLGESPGAEELFTAAACKLAGGQWKGGHDISGHVFLLVLGSCFLGMEMLPALMRRGRVGAGKSEEQKGGNWGWGVVVGVMGLSWWMLLMTAAYFHTWFEKVS